MRLIDADKTNVYTYELDKQVFVDAITRFISLQPTVEAIPIDKPFLKMRYGDYVVYNKKWLVNHLQTEWNILQGKEYQPSIPIELYEQVKGERDVAIEQLKALNIELFEKPYLKAIPIEWLYQKRTLYLENKCYMSLMVINEILNWWEKENG